MWTTENAISFSMFLPILLDSVAFKTSRDA